MVGNTGMVTGKTKWWKFALALVVFWIGPLVIGAVIAVFLSISNIFTPRAFRNTQEWINLISSIFACFICTSFADSITDKKHKTFCMINCVIAATIWIGDTVLSAAMQTIEFTPALTQVVRAIVYIVLAVMMYGEAKSALENTKADKESEL